MLWDIPPVKNLGGEEKLEKIAFLDEFLSLSSTILVCLCFCLSHTKAECPTLYCLMQPLNPTVANLYHPKNHGYVQPLSLKLEVSPEVPGPRKPGRKGFILNMLFNTVRI